MSALSEILDDLDTQMLHGFDDYRSQVRGTWHGFAGNEGQLIIVHQHIIPVCQDHINYAKEEWPINTGPDELVDEILNSYDPDVIERAFSDTLYGMYDEIASIHMESMDFQMEHNYVLGREVAHSTNPPWTA